MIERLRLILIISHLASCSSYVKVWRGRMRKGHQQFSSRQGKRNPAAALFAQRNVPDVRSKITQYSTRRRYDPVKRRRTVNGLYDNSNESSLWSGEGQDNYLLAQNNIKKHGDIVIINIGSKLKQDITSEISRTISNIVIARGRRNIGQATAARGDSGDIHEKISSIVIDEINKEHLLIRGRKNFFYKRKKRLIEVQALVARSDIDDSGMVHSDKMLDLKITILR